MRIAGKERRAAAKQWRELFSLLTQCKDLAAPEDESELKHVLRKATDLEYDLTGDTKATSKILDGLGIEEDGFD